MDRRALGIRGVACLMLLLTVAGPVIGTVGVQRDDKEAAVYLPRSMRLGDVLAQQQGRNRLGDLLRSRKQRGEGHLSLGQHASQLRAVNKVHVPLVEAEGAEGGRGSSVYVRGNISAHHHAPSLERNATQAAPCSFPEMRHLCRRLRHQSWSRYRTPDFVENAVRATGLAKDCKVPAVAPKRVTSTGERTKLIVMVGLGGGEICDKRTHDWRARFPRYLGRMVDATVVVWRIRFNTCFTCSTQSVEPRDCAELMNAGVDALVVLGSGRYREDGPCREEDIHDTEGQSSTELELSDSEDEPITLPLTGGLPACPYRYRDLWHMMQLEWARNARFKVHFPIRRMPDVMENQLFSFDRIIDDSSFNKPPSLCTSEILSRCRRVHKMKHLIYVARLTPGKGQLTFLQNLDGELMRDYTLHMYGGINSTLYPNYRSQLRAVAKEKQLRIRMHGEVSKGKLIAGVCSAMGMVHFARDKNPRAVYEAVQAGLPAFINREAQVSPDLEAAPFIQVAANSTGEFNAAFSKFVASLSRDWGSVTARWVERHLQEQPVYGSLCERMCLCQGRDTPPSCPLPP